MVIPGGSAGMRSISCSARSCARRACVPPSKACRRHRCRIRSKRPGPAWMPAAWFDTCSFPPIRWSWRPPFPTGSFWKRSSTARSGRPWSWKGIWMSWPPGRGPSCICATPTGVWSSVLLWCASCCACSIVSFLPSKTAFSSMRPPWMTWKRILSCAKN